MASSSQLRPSRFDSRPLRILQAGDFHFAAPARPDLVAAFEELVARERYDVVVFCGDFAQRSRIGELLCGAALVRHAQRYSQTIVVPGNHDIAWWRSPLHVFGAERISRKYREWLDPELEPVLSVPGATFVGLNSSHGIAPYTLTSRLRDLAVVGAVTAPQLTRSKDLLNRIPAGDLRAIVMHHNPVRGELSQRFGIPNHREVLRSFASAGCDIVLCGHDHQEHVTRVALPDGAGGERGILVSACGTISSRSRGGRPCSATAITVDVNEIQLAVQSANAAGTAFESGRQFRFPRGK
ncbi:MAG: metallophosphoesterase family protein [Gemmatimonadaceae bacterium]